MIHVVSTRHPRQAKPDGTKVEHSCCRTRTGWHSSSKSWRHSDIRDMGVGISVYFKFLKFMMVLSIWFTLLSIPAYVLYVNGNQSGVVQLNLKWALSAPTLGNIGQCKFQFFNSSVAQNSCNYASLTGNLTNVTLFCPYGTMQSIVQMGLSPSTGGDSSCPKTQYQSLSVDPYCNM